MRIAGALMLVHEWRSGQFACIYNDLHLSPLEQRCKTRVEALSELKLEYVKTSGYNFNCLAFSVMMATKQIDASRAAQAAANAQSDKERRLTAPDA